MPKWPIQAVRHRKMLAMNKLVLIGAVVFAASPAGAQLAAPNDQVSSSTQGAATGGAQGGPTSPAQAPITGVFCIEEMTATFCNVVTGPNTGGYGTRSGSNSGSAGTTGSAGAAAGGSTSAMPPCPAEPPFNELFD